LNDRVLMHIRVIMDNRLVMDDRLVMNDWGGDDRFAAAGLTRVRRDCHKCECERQGGQGDQGDQGIGADTCRGSPGEWNEQGLRRWQKK
jgi:hypothetical protein